MDLVNRLVERGASLSQKDMHGWTPLHTASEKGHLNVVNRLVELGLSVREKGTDGIAPLLLATLNGHNDVAVFLLRNNAICTEKLVGNATVTLLLKVRETMLAALAYGFNQPVSKTVLQRVSMPMQVLFRHVHDLSPLQVFLRLFSSLLASCYSQS